MNYFSMPSNIFCARGDVFEGRTGFGCVNDSFEPEYVTVSGKIEQTASYYPYGEPWLEPEGDNRRLYSGKERLNFGALRHSDYGPRLLDTRSGRWNSQDPCAEEFYPLSPYSVCGGDPINYVDRDGRRFTEASMPAVNRLLEEAFKGFLSSKVYAIDYARAFVETLIMQVSDQLFHISAISPLGNTGATIYDSEMDAVTFIIPGGAFGPLGLIAHEFKHGYQFLTGEIDLSVNGEACYENLFYDIHDEAEAYARGYLFGADYFSLEDIKKRYFNLHKIPLAIKNISQYDERWELYKEGTKFRGLQKLSEFRNRAFRFKSVTYKP